MTNDEFDVTGFSDRMTAAQGAFRFAILTLRVIEWSDDEIKELLEIELKRGEGEE